MSASTKSFEVLVHASPRSHREKVEWDGNGNLKVWTTASPVDGQATSAILATVAKAFGVRKSAVALLSGATSRTKRIRIEGIDLEEAHVRLSG